MASPLRHLARRLTRLPRPAGGHGGDSTGEDPASRLVRHGRGSRRRGRARRRTARRLAGLVVAGALAVMILAVLAAPERPASVAQSGGGYAGGALGPEAAYRVTSSAVLGPSAAALGPAALTPPPSSPAVAARPAPPSLPVPAPGPVPLNPRPQVAEAPPALPAAPPRNPRRSAEEEGPPPAEPDAPGPVVAARPGPAAPPFAPAVPRTGPPPSAPAFAWLDDAVRAAKAADGPMIALIIDDMGVNLSASRAALDLLPPPVTMAFLPYARKLGEQTARARRKGHELLLHVPMQPSGDADPGPGALLAGLTGAEFDRRLEDALGRFPGYVGVNNHMGSRLTADPAAMARVMRDLRRRGLLYVDSFTSSASVAADAARRAGVPVAVRDVFLDDTPDGRAIRVQLRRLEARARAGGAAIGIGHPHRATLDELRAWLPGVRARGFQLVPASVVVARAYCAANPDVAPCRVLVAQAGAG